MMETGDGGRLARFRARGAALADFFFGAALALRLALAAGADGAGGFLEERARADDGGVLARFFAVFAAGGRVERFARALAPTSDDVSDDLA